MNVHSRWVLGELTKAVATLNFDDGLRLLSLRDGRGVDWGKIQADADELNRLKIRSLSAEIYDHAGQYENARRVIEADGILSETILRHARPGGGEAARNLHKQHVWVLIHRGMLYYREDHYLKARELFRLCRRALQKLVIDEGDPSHFTLSRIHYSLGLVARQLYEYKAARPCFKQSIDEAWWSFINRTDGKDTADPVYQQTKMLTSFYVAKSSALGLAWMYYTEGVLKLAAPLMVSAQLLLANTKEVVIRSCIDVLWASILAAQGDRRRAIWVLERSYRKLANHPPYRTRAAAALAVIYIHEVFRLDKPQDEAERERCVAEARRYIAEMKEFGTTPLSGTRWQCNALIAESRLLRALGDFRGAEAAATDAYDLGGKQDFIRIDALIARGEARLELGEFKAASEDFDGALSDNRDNRKVQAVCHLHLARAHAFMGDRDDALSHQAEAARELEHVDNAFVRELAKKVEELLAEPPGEDFRISSAAQKLNHRYEEWRLRRFLAQWAGQRAGVEKRRPWDILDISKSAYYDWLRGGPKPDDAPVRHKPRRAGDGTRRAS